MARVTTSYRGDKIGLLALDPGRTTGLVTATLKLEGSVAEIFAAGEWEASQVKCYDPTLPEFLMERTGARDVCEIWRDCQAEWNLAGIPYSHHFFVFEDFNLRGLVSLDRNLLSPVRITSLIQGMLIKYPVQWVCQQPEQAKSRWTNPRLKRAGLWAVGLPHARDALRHAALAVQQLAA